MAAAAGSTVPPASGKNAIRARYWKPAMRSVSLPTHRPAKWRRSRRRRRPRVRPGFQDSGRPLIGSSAAMPGRSTAPGPGASPANGLLSHR